MTLNIAFGITSVIIPSNVNFSSQETSTTATVDEYGNKVNRKVKLEIFEIGWESYWESSNPYEVGRYVTNSSRNLIYSDEFQTQVVPTSGSVTIMLSADGVNFSSVPSGSFDAAVDEDV